MHRDTEDNLTHIMASMMASATADPNHENFFEDFFEFEDNMCIRRDDKVWNFGTYLFETFVAMIQVMDEKR